MFQLLIKTNPRTLKFESKLIVLYRYILRPTSQKGGLNFRDDISLLYSVFLASFILIPALFMAVEHGHLEKARTILESTDVDVNRYVF